MERFHRHFYEFWFELSRGSGVNRVLIARWKGLFLFDGTLYFYFIVVRECSLCIPAPRNSLMFSPQTDKWSVFVNISRFTSICVDDYKGVNYRTLYPKTYLTDSAV